MNASFVGSQQSVVPSSLPKLPGCAFKDPTAVKYHKSHLFDVKAGVASVRDPPGVDVPNPVGAHLSTHTTFSQ